MKVSIKRPTAGTVPRKLEQVNLCCVVSATNHERLSVVRQDRAPRSIGCLSGQAIPAAPFWELESLILQGFQRELALDILAARRSGAARRERPATWHYRSPAPVPAMASHKLTATAETY
jgi:hypothetical protein